MVVGDMGWVDSDFCPILLWQMGIWQNGNLAELAGHLDSMVEHTVQIKVNPTHVTVHDC